MTTDVKATNGSESYLQQGQSFTVHLDKSSDYTLMFHSPGFTAQQEVVGRSIHPAIWGTSPCSLRQQPFSSIW